MEELQNNSDSSMNLDVGLKVQANIDPIVNATPKALGTLFNMLFPKKYREAARLTMLSAAQDQVDVQKILERKAIFDQDSGILIEKVASSKDLRSLVSELVQEEETSNLIACMVQAAIQMEDEKISIETEINSEFMARWRNDSRFVSEEMAQAVWGKVLSEEVKKPNSVSIRTLEVIKNLTREEAEVFREACKFVIFDQSLIVSNVDGCPLPNRAYGLLRDAGLLADFQDNFYTSGYWMETQIEFADRLTKAYYLRLGNLFIFVEQEQVSKKPSVTYRRLTQAGRELFKIISGNVEYDVTAIGKVLTENEKGIGNYLKYTNYNNVNENSVDLDKVKSFF